MRIDVTNRARGDRARSAARKVEVNNRAHGRTFQLGFDQLHVATGALPRRPDLPGSTSRTCTGCRPWTTPRPPARTPRSGGRSRVVVLGSGYIGLEMAEAFVDGGLP